MQNWYCRIHFPDGTEGVHLVPGPAPIYDSPIRIVDRPGLWKVVDNVARVQGDEYAAEIWVSSLDDCLSTAVGSAGRTTG